MRIQAPIGMHDILPDSQPFFHKVYATASSVAQFYGFKKIDTPIVENAELFSKGIGLSTDIVEKEMYSFRSKGGDFFSLAS